MSFHSRPQHIPIIDEEHRGIQRAFANLIEAILLGSGTAKVLEAAQQAVQVTLLHFEHEEAMLREISFAELKEHRKNHQKIAQMLERVTAELKNQDSAAALNSLRKCRRLLLVHLQTEDESYRDAVNRYAAERGIPPLPQRIRHLISES